jgi:hypothetical protein
LRLGISNLHKKAIVYPLLLKKKLLHSLISDIVCLQNLHMESIKKGIERIKNGNRIMCTRFCALIAVGNLFALIVKAIINK